MRGLAATRHLRGLEQGSQGPAPSYPRGRASSPSRRLIGPRRPPGSGSLGRSTPAFGWFPVPWGMRLAWWSGSSSAPRSSGQSRSAGPGCRPRPGPPWGAWGPGAGPDAGVEAARLAAEAGGQVQHRSPAPAEGSRRLPWLVSVAPDWLGAGRRPGRPPHLGPPAPAAGMAHEGNEPGGGDRATPRIWVSLAPWVAASSGTISASRPAIWPSRAASSPARAAALPAVAAGWAASAEAARPISRPARGPASRQPRAAKTCRNPATLVAATLAGPLPWASNPPPPGRPWCRRAGEHRGDPAWVSVAEHPGHRGVDQRPGLLPHPAAGIDQVRTAAPQRAQGGRRCGVQVWRRASPRATSAPIAAPSSPSVLRRRCPAGWAPRRPGPG
jgi:hypothetical protein